MPFGVCPVGGAGIFREGGVRVIRWLNYAMVYLGSALMVYNICGFVRFARFIKNMKSWDHGAQILNIPVLLLVFFLLGYLAVGFFGEPDLVIADILFGGSVFVFVMYRLLNTIIQKVVEDERLEAELLAAEESNRAKSGFLASISHEMRTPMNVILGLDTVALKNPALPEETRGQLEKIGQSARHLAGLINNILDMQQLGSGELVIHSEAFSLKEALEQVKVLTAAACEAKGLTFETEFAECAPRDYTGDAAQLKRALMCLLDNAVKYTDAPGRVTFRVACDKTEGVCTELYFIVSDTGVGIDPAFLERIFELFAREDISSTDRFGGSGMGLPVAQAIARQMGGEIRAESVKGEGSTFTLVLPIPDAGAQCGCEGSRACAEDGERLLDKRILIVEDMPENAEIVADLLELEGAVCEHADNGLAAVNMFTESKPYHYDAILMDLRMPVMDGLESARRLRALDRPDAGTVPILALTANAFDSDVEASLAAGMNEHLKKPVDAEKLYAALEYWIRRTEGEGGTSA